MSDRSIRISGINQSAVSVGSSGSIANHVSQSGGTPSIEELKSLLSRLREIAPELGLTPAAKAELLAEVNTADAQSGSPKPKQGVITESLRSIRAILESAAGSGLYVAAIDRFLGS